MAVEPIRALGAPALDADKDRVEASFVHDADGVRETAVRDDRALRGRSGKVGRRQ